MKLRYFRLWIVIIWIGTLGLMFQKCEWDFTVLTPFSSHSNLIAIHGFFVENPKNCTKWPNTLKQFVGKLPANCLSVSDHFVRLALKGLKSGIIFSMTWYECFVENQIRIRTSWGWKLSKNKYTEPHRNFIVSYKKWYIDCLVFC